VFHSRKKTYRKKL